MNRIKMTRIAVLLLCVGLPFLKVTADRSAMHGAISATDFGLLYYGARCAMDRCDPYSPKAMLSEFEADGGKLGRPNSEGAIRSRTVLTTILYPPTALLVAAPLAMFRWPVALAIFTALMGGLLLLAAFLVWDLAGEVPLLAGTLASLVLLNCELLFWYANPAGIVVPLCLIAGWCFLEERFALAGVAMLATALLIKPHDAGFVWLYFLLAGGTGRKRALQTLVVVVVLAVFSGIWIAPVSPHWTEELHSNLVTLSARGGLTDPGPSGPDCRGLGPFMNLQAAVAIFRNDPHFYDPLSYAIAGGLILIWVIAVLRKRSSMKSALFSLAAISLLTLLPVYHRTYDAKLLLLAIPACALLWAGGGARRWVALGLTSAAIFVTSDIPLFILNSATGTMVLSTATLGGKLTQLLLEPAPVLLLATGCFYLWVYIRYDESRAGCEKPAEEWLDTALAE